MSIDIGVMLRGQYPFGVDMAHMAEDLLEQARLCLLYTSPSPRDRH